MTHEKLEEKTSEVSLRYKLLTLWTLSWPNILLSIIQTLIPMSTTYFIGHLGSVPLAAAALGNMICNTSGLSLGVGLTQSLDTFCTQAYGAKQYKLVGLHCQRAMAISTVACVPIILIWCFTEPILKLVGVEPEVARLSGVWTMWLIPGLWPNLQFECFKRYLIAQSITWPQAASVILVAGLHGFFCWLIIQHFDVGFVGAPMIVSISNWSMLIFALIFAHINTRFFPKPKEFQLETPPSSVVCSIESTSSSSSCSEVDAGDLNIQIYHLKQADNDTDDEKENVDRQPLLVETDPNDTWPALSRQIFMGWGQFLSIGIPTSVSLFVEWGSWEVNAFFVAHYGSNSLAAHAIAANLAGLWYMPALGLSSAVTTLIGNSLGSHRPDLARSYARIGLVVCFIFSIVNGALGMAYRNVIGRVFSDVPEVCSLVATLMLILWPYHVVDLQKCLGTGILRGCGRPKVTMLGNVISTLVVGYPLAYVFGWLLNLKTVGIWISMTIAWTTAALIYIIFILRIDWDYEVSQSKGRIQESQQAQDRMLVQQKKEEAQSHQVEAKLLPSSMQVQLVEVA